MKDLWIKSVAFAALAVGVYSEPLPLRVNLDIEFDLKGDDYVRIETPTTGSGSSHATVSDSLPTANLGYEDHQASPDEAGSNLWRFENIPYARPPKGELRFKEAQSLEPVDQPPLNVGNVSAICPQITPGWFPPAAGFLSDYFGPSIISEKWDKELPPKDYEAISKSNISNLANEDCLTLDVILPKSTWANRKTTKRPVLVWISGGGFVFGSKIAMGGPAGLFARSGTGSEDEFIFVAINYRLGALGFLAGDSFENEGGFENAGLSDQLVAFEWIRDHIEEFGGDPGHVTVMGESAGAASILHHITANGGEGEPPPFQQAILQSPAFFPQIDRTKMEDLYKSFLLTAGAANIDELVAMDPDTGESLIWANAVSTYYSEYGTFSFGPVVDGTYVPDLPGRLLAEGKFHKDIKIMVGYNRREGMIFTPPWIRTKEAFKNFVLDVFPHFDPDGLDNVTDTMYPVPTGNIAKDKIAPVAEALGDVACDCNTFYINEALGGDTYYYRFSLYPGFHSQDTDYTFYPSTNPAFPSLKPNPKQASALQRYITSFVKTGEPVSDTDGDFDLNKKEGKILSFGRWETNKLGLPVFKDEVGMVDDPLSRDHCEFWQAAPYAPEDTYAWPGMVMQKNAHHELKV